MQHAWPLSRLALVASCLVALASCGDSGARPAPPPCDAKCYDQIALRAIRESMKVAFNLTLQGKPVGAHDVTAPCPLGGRARVFGTATSNADQGSTFVDLTYVADECVILEVDDEPKENYRVTLSGTITQKGVLAVQPTSTSALSISSASVTLRGTVFEPAVPYEAVGCPLTVGQNGNRLTGTLCGREVAVDL